MSSKTYLITIIALGLLLFGCLGQPSETTETPVQNVTPEIRTNVTNISNITDSNISTQIETATLTVNFEGVGNGTVYIYGPNVSLGFVGDSYYPYVLKPANTSFYEPGNPNRIITEFPILGEEPYPCRSNYSPCSITFVKGANITASGVFTDQFSWAQDSNIPCTSEERLRTDRFSCNLILDEDKTINITLQRLTPESVTLDSFYCTNLSVREHDRTVQLIATGMVSAPYMRFEVEIEDRNFTQNSTDLKSIQSECWNTTNEGSFYGLLYISEGMSVLRPGWNTGNAWCYRPPSFGVIKESPWKVTLNKTACLIDSIDCDTIVNVNISIYTDRYNTRSGLPNILTRSINC